MFGESAVNIHQVRGTHLLVVGIGNAKKRNNSYDSATNSLRTSSACSTQTTPNASLPLGEVPQTIKVIKCHRKDENGQIKIGEEQHNKPCFSFFFNVGFIFPQHCYSVMGRYSIES